MNVSFATKNFRYSMTAHGRTRTPLRTERRNGGGGGNRTRVRKSSAVRPTYLAWSFGSRLAPAGRLADAQPVASTDARGQATKPRTGADVNDAALRLRSLAHQQTSAASSRY